MKAEDPDLADLRRMLEASIGQGPPLPPPSDRLIEGRRVLRRRRHTALAGIAGGVTVLVAASIAVQMLIVTGPRGSEFGHPPGSSAVRGSGQDLSAPTADRTQQPRRSETTTNRARKDEITSDDHPAVLEFDGTLVVKHGWEVTRRVPEPMGYEPPEGSVGLVVTDGLRTRWMLLTVERIDGGLYRGASSDDPGKGYSGFDDWLANMVELNAGADIPNLVTVNVRDQVRAGPGSALVEVRSAPVVKNYTSAGDRLVHVTRDGRNWFVVIRGHARDAETIEVDARVLSAPTFDALLTYIAAQVSSGEGVR